MPLWYADQVQLVKDNDSFGATCLTRDRASGRDVAVRKMYHPFHGSGRAKCVFQELALLRKMKHENIITLLDLYSPDTSEDFFDDVYFVMESFTHNLKEIIEEQPDEITPSLVCGLTYQVLCGLKYLHSGYVIHRNLEPANLVITSDGVVKIINFSLARDIDKECMTGYVASRFYRAPEIYTHWAEYDSSVDMWSLACIVAELVTKKPLFPGRDFIEHLQLVMKLVGAPRDRFLVSMTTDARTIISKSFPKYPRRSLKTLAAFADADGDLVSFLDDLLILEPNKRMAASHALEHRYFETYHSEESEPEAVGDILGDLSELDYRPGVCFVELVRCFVIKWRRLHPW